MMEEKNQKMFGGEGGVETLGSIKATLFLTSLEIFPRLC